MNGKDQPHLETPRLRSFRDIEQGDSRKRSQVDELFPDRNDIFVAAVESGGTVDLESNEGVGTTVRLYFPAVDEARAEEMKPHGRALDRPGDETVLVVEDRQDVVGLAGMIFEDFGYTVLHAPDARRALDMLDAKVDIALLFSDLIMPGEINGVALAREAKRRYSGLKVLLTTGYAEASLQRTDAGGPEFDVLNKPYGRAELARKIRVIRDGATGVT